MDINLPLILVLLSLAGIVILLVDRFVLQPRRQQAMEALQEELPDWDKPSHAAARIYQERLEKINTRHWLVAETRSLLPVILVVLVIRSFLVEPFQIPSASMEPTLQVGDFILVNKYVYGIRLPVTGTKVLGNELPKRGDVMVFFPPNDDRYFIKRVIGVPGDLIEYEGKILTINGKVQSLQLGEEEGLDPHQREMFLENLDGHSHSVYHQSDREAFRFVTTVQPGHYFMMGDNRDNSSDSRFWGQVPEERIVGKAFFIWMHWKNWLSLPTFSRVVSFE